MRVGLTFCHSVRVTERLRRSFSNVKWKHIFELYGIKHVEKIPVFRPSVLYISRETCKDIFQGIQANEMATCALSQATSETKVVTWMNSMLTPILQMFNGVINNDAEGKLGESSSSTGGFIEFIYMVLEACVVVVIECKYNTYTQDDVAQMMVELEAAWHNNVMQQLGTPILTGALCSRDIWQYWRYDGTNFQQSTNFLIRHHDPLADAKELVKMFGIFYDMFFDGYIRSLKGFISKSEKVCGRLLHPSRHKLTQHPEWHPFRQADPEPEGPVTRNGKRHCRWRSRHIRQRRKPLHLLSSTTSRPSCEEGQRGVRLFSTELRLNFSIQFQGTAGGALQESG
ncbi:uncharacterized protein EV422DRAFT_498879 [Fimicolochytrium jonesii]|uniref:uncharacterized protein n=1 Tax=Fimicolochytrium jonesii TaxID=1396493 RepID=UPI0022FF0B05|nr:uncharacterized protein EV422DRAFT_498879 [Fimicolochytrium jonesii]KAI8818494.1 hypothetical protein EV422DRAFT_498879 [Fimicolochytrium jonesii]